MIKQKRPTFIHIGTSRTASTWLHSTLNAHPEIFIPEGKDTLYFLNTDKQPLSWYLSFFDDADDEKAIGEICHRYFSSFIAAQRIFQTFPDLKIVCCLREPLDRMISAYTYFQQIGLYIKDDFLTFTRRQEIRKEFNYLENLRTYYKLFPKNQIHLNFYEDLKADSYLFLQKLLYFLEVDTHVALPADHKIWLNRPARFLPLTHFAYSASQYLRAHGIFNFTGKMKNSYIINQLLFKQSPLVFKQKMDPDILHALHSEVARTYSQIEDLTGLAIPKSWHHPLKEFGQ